MENEFFNTYSLSYCVDGKQWLSTRIIKDVDDKLVYKIPLHSYIANNALYIIKGLFELIKVLLGSGLIYLIIEKLC